VLCIASLASLRASTSDSNSGDKTRSKEIRMLPSGQSYTGIWVIVQAPLLFFPTAFGALEGKL
jgi:hypothetical protein